MQREAQGSCPTTGTAKAAALALEVKGSERMVTVTAALILKALFHW